MGLAVGFMMSFPFMTCTGQLPETSEASVSAEEIRSAIDFLASDDLAGRATGTGGIDNAARYIESRFDEAGLQPYFETYRDSFMVGDKNAFNIVGLLKGNDENLKNEYIIIGAHYDHIGHGSPVEGDSIANGANDNAAGTVGVLEIAKQLAENKNNKRSIIFALFSAEEMGLKGSEHLAKKLKKENLDLYAMINFEMIGVPMKAKDYEAYITGYENSNLAEKFNEYSGGDKILGFLPQAKQLNLFKRSDNYPFYTEFNVPAQTICTFDFSNYPYYHHVDDEASLMDAEHMAALIEKLIPGLSALANTEEREIKLND